MRCDLAAAPSVGKVSLRETAMRGAKILQTISRLVLAIFCLLALPSPGLAGEAEWQSLLESGVSEFKAAWRTSSWKSADKHFVQAATLLEKALHEAKEALRREIR